MNDRNKTVYRSGIDLWILCVIIFALVVVWVATISTKWWVALLSGGGLTALCVVGFCGCWYEIDGDQLVVYNLFRPHRFPIGKIREVKKSTGYLATAGASSKRVSIRFTDRSVMKSSMPLEISPADRDGFIAHLKRINPGIIVL